MSGLANCPNIRFYGIGTTGSGSIGPPGPQGFTGPTGPQGNAGTATNTGATGPQGTQGTQGPQGHQGNAGSATNTGATGPQGNQGTQGTQGPQGFTGNSGATGPAGIVGTLAESFSIYVNQDFTTSTTGSFVNIPNWTDTLSSIDFPDGAPQLVFENLNEGGVLDLTAGTFTVAKGGTYSYTITFIGPNYIGSVLIAINGGIGLPIDPNVNGLAELENGDVVSVACYSTYTGGTLTYITTSSGINVPNLSWAMELVALPALGPTGPQGPQGVTGAGNSWMTQQMASDVQNPLVSYVPLGLSFSVVSGKRYAFRASLQWEVDPNAGTSIQFHFFSPTTYRTTYSWNYSSNQPTLTYTDFNTTMIFTPGTMQNYQTQVNGFFWPSASGNFGLEFSCIIATTSGSYPIVYAGSYLEILQLN